MTSRDDGGETTRTTGTTPPADQAGNSASTANEPFPVISAILSGLVVAASVVTAQWIYAEGYARDILFFSSFGAFLLYVGLMMAFMLSEQVTFSGLQLGAISFGEARSRHGRFFLVMYLPVTGFGAFFRTILSSPFLGILWTLLVSLLLFCLNFVLRDWIATITRAA